MKRSQTEEKLKRNAGPVMVFTDRILGFSNKLPPILDPSHPIDYSKRETPPSYKCGKCGATGCKLWREYQTFLEHQDLLCAKCAAEDQKKDISDIGEDGRYTYERFGDRLSKTDQIGWMCPAVPTEENDTFWGYTSVPQAGCDWWHNLPTFPQTIYLRHRK